MTIPPLQALICFDAVARHMSMKAAAEELGISSSAVSQQIARLEAWINVRLFMRGSRSLTLTPEGGVYLRAIRPAFHQISLATQRVIDNVSHNKVTVSCSTEFALRWLLPKLALFEHFHPGAEVLINTSHRDIDMNNDGVDFALRHSAKVATGLVSHRLGNSGGLQLFYDKSAVLQPVCRDFRDWLLAMTAAENPP